MVVLKPKSSSFNSLWSISYSVIVVSVQCYISYRNISEYQDSLRNQWNRETPPEVGLKLGLTIVSFIVLPFFLLSSIFRTGNYGNDGYKLGRDHAICPISGGILDHIGSEFGRRLWRYAPPFAPSLHVLSAFCLLFPDVLISGKEIQLQLKPTEAVWSTDLDFLFSDARALTSDFLTKNISAVGLANLTGYSSETAYITPNFLNFVFALTTFAIRYSAVFWYTNKTLSFVYAAELLFMSFDSIFMFAGFSILYKLTKSIDRYNDPVYLILNSSGILGLYITSGFVVMFSSYVVFEYSAYHFMEKFKKVDRKHNPEKYKNQSIASKGICNGYFSHSSAVVIFILLAVFRGPIYYDIIAVYRLTSDGCLLACLVVGVCYLVTWIFLWTLLTIKQEWMFRILDYANVGQPIFVIKSDRLSKTNSISIGSIELKDVTLERKRGPGSVPSIDITPSESGFDECEVGLSSEDDRYGTVLAPVHEDSIENGFPSDVIVRRNRHRRSGPRCVTFHDPIRHSVGSLCERDPSRSRSPAPSESTMHVTAEVHRLGPRTQYQRRSSDPEMKQAFKRRHNNIMLAALRNNTSSPEIKNNADYLTNVNDLSTSSDDVRSNASEPLLNQPMRLSDARNYGTSFGNAPQSREMAVYKPSNLDTAREVSTSPKTPVNAETSLDTSVSLTESGIAQSNVTDITTILSEDEYENFKGAKQPDIVPNQHSGSPHRVYPKPQNFISNTKPGVSRRDSANYSMASSQDTSSNDSDPVQRPPALCSQV